MTVAPDFDAQIADFLAGTLAVLEERAFIATLRRDAALRDQVAAAAFFSPLGPRPRSACAAARGEICTRLDRKLFSATQAHLRSCAACARIARIMEPRRRLLRWAAALALLLGTALVGAALLMRRYHFGG